MILIARPSGEHVCSNEAANIIEDPLFGGGAACVDAMASGDIAGFGLLLTLVSPYFIEPGGALAEPRVIGMKTEHHLGQRARCYRFGPPADLAAAIATRTQGLELDETPDRDYRECFTPDGVLTSVRASGEPSYGLVATEVGGVTDADFEPPYPIVDPD